MAARRRPGGSTGQAYRDRLESGSCRKAWGSSPRPSSDALAFFRDTLAVRRLTRLATTDTITQPVRSAIDDAAYSVHMDPPSFAQRRVRALAQFADEMLKCDWCTSVWVAGAATVARRAAPKPWAALATVLAFSEASMFVKRTQPHFPAQPDGTW